nr:MAG TPA: hypothetical protein [Caudoviricetes sp.]
MAAHSLSDLSKGNLERLLGPKFAILSDLYYN